MSNIPKQYLNKEKQKSKIKNNIEMQEKATIILGKIILLNPDILTKANVRVSKLVTNLLPDYSHYHFFWGSFRRLVTKGYDCNMGLFKNRYK